MNSFNTTINCNVLFICSFFIHQNIICQGLHIINVQFFLQQKETVQFNWFIYFLLFLINSFTYPIATWTVITNHVQLIPPRTIFITYHSTSKVHRVSPNHLRIMSSSMGKPVQFTHLTILLDLYVLTSLLHCNLDSSILWDLLVIVNIIT